MNFFFHNSRCLRNLHSVPCRSLARRPLVLRTLRPSARRYANLAGSSASGVSQKKVPPQRTRVPQVRAFGFRELGIDEKTLSQVENVFPHVKRPTLSQAEYIPAILQGQDVVVHDETGTGK